MKQLTGWSKVVVQYQNQEIGHLNFNLLGNDLANGQVLMFSKS